MEQRLKYDVFSQQVNTMFRVRLDEARRLDIELIAVERRPSPPAQDIFSLIFRGPLDPRLLQHLFDIEHEAMGEFQLFLVPIGRDEQGFLYEAVFNRLVRKES